jgi:hypothetical protein
MRTTVTLQQHISPGGNRDIDVVSRGLVRLGSACQRGKAWGGRRLLWDLRCNRMPGKEVCTFGRKAPDADSLCSKKRIMRQPPAGPGPALPATSTNHAAL